MEALEEAQRRELVKVALSWQRTPYHHMGRVKGAGVDCLTLLAGVFEEAKLVERVPIPFYPQDWHLHKDAERYLEGLLKYTREIKGPPLPGDIVLWKFGRCYAHGAIVIEWPIILHAYIGRAVTLEDAEKAAWLNFIGENTADRGKPRPKRFFSYWGF